MTTAKFNLDYVINPPEVKFRFEDFLTDHLSIILTKPEKQEVCQYYLKNICRMGSKCAYKHPSKTKLVVCKHWLRGLCKKGEDCEFLHEYNLKKMPECWFFAKLGECTNPECLYLHIDPDSRQKECAWYARGFCKHGADCRHKHTRAAACPNYLVGFCPKGDNCTFGHPKYELPVLNSLADIAAQQQLQQIQPQPQQRKAMKNNDRSGFRQISEVTCFKCGEKGHYANHCPNKPNPFQ
ncbi:hypothetical protein HK103_005030 [Boothiomyces macroporosus]|uniref:mRNA 3'-end-processing protein n=1 Tax=Boothiomyces macroporosus TaxID=261099 RepID=A0AAD5UFP4_9FUNG|nr:hypothetical protein HK103_005030 [Boothiomyces macroporosus]KAJ3315613.1 hypothetical protein HDV04_002027 [Boothiomyces sp. JEL0838]